MPRDQRRAERIGAKGGGLLVLCGIHRRPGGAVHHRIRPRRGEGGGHGLRLVEFEVRLADQDGVEAGGGKRGLEPRGELPAAPRDENAPHHQDPSGNGGAMSARRGALRSLSERMTLFASTGQAIPKAGSSQAMPPSASRS